MRLPPARSQPVSIPANPGGRPGAGLAPPARRHQHVWPASLSRRRFLAVAAGSATAGAAFGAGLLRPGGAAAEELAATPRPIPGGSPGIAAAFGTLFHVYAPGSPGLDADDAEPATITDFHGAVGLAYVSGMVTRTNKQTGEVRQLPFVDSDMRFMTGVFRGADGRRHEGTFGFI